MGAAAQKRGDTVIARQSEHRYTEHDVAIAKRSLARENQRLASLVEKQQREIEALRSLVDHLEAAKRDEQQARAELSALQEREGQLRRSYLAALRSSEIWQHSHAKLSEIVRLALTPEKYHRYREIVEMYDEPEVTPQVSRGNEEA